MARKVSPSKKAPKVSPTKQDDLSEQPVEPVMVWVNAVHNVIIDTARALWRKGGRFEDTEPSRRQLYEATLTFFERLLTHDLMIDRLQRRKGAPAKIETLAVGRIMQVINDLRSEGDDAQGKLLDVVTDKLLRGIHPPQPGESGAAVRMRRSRARKKASHKSNPT
jgi:hypothetical protein